MRGERVEDVIREAGSGEKDAPLIEDGFRQAAAGMQTNGISSEELEEGELEEEPESVQTYPKRDSIENFPVGGQREYPVSSMAHVLLGASDHRV